MKAAIRVTYRVSHGTHTGLQGSHKTEKNRLIFLSLFNKSIDLSCNSLQKITLWNSTVKSKYELLRDANLLKPRGTASAAHWILAVKI